ncbi:hypothetical protein RvY_18001 [Ramazzottius varieornatus]|uniref:Uncharacterized protein n=1 Tax=Ramazzottius varieornatus TaxID=947166 RepID=A0A1D1W465_RAMVA|nr:hypothetical protein RvY_18001 [Ramazzottius varieornatus]
MEHTMIKAILKNVASLRTCPNTHYSHSSRGNELGKPFQLILPGPPSNRGRCPNCYNAERNARLASDTRTKRKTDQQELRSITKKLKFIQENNDKLLFGSSRAVVKLLEDMTENKEQ